MLRCLASSYCLWLTILATACSPATTKIVARERPVVTRLLPGAHGSSALEGIFRQEGHAISGTVNLTRTCSLETTHTVLKEEATETSWLGTGAAVGYITVGAALSAVGTGLLIASKDKDHTVRCSDQPEEGDTCSSTAGAYRYAGIMSLGLGLTSAGMGTYGLLEKPKIKTKELPPERTISISAGVSCGSTESLRGLVISLELPGRGRWTGAVMANGGVRIDVNDEVTLPEGEVNVVVDVVPESLAALIARGTAIGTVSLGPKGPAPAAHDVVRRHQAR